MFQPVPRQFTMTDPERGYSWGSRGTTDTGQVHIAVLTIDGVEIPYEYRVDERRDESTPWYDVQLGAFGHSIAGQLQHGLTQHHWASDAEREAAVLIAIEATLAWRPGGRGIIRGDGYNRATFKGIQYHLSDFGPYFGTEVANAVRAEVVALDARRQFLDDARRGDLSDADAGTVQDQAWRR